MKIYFSASHYQKDLLKNCYRIIDYLQKTKHEVFEYLVPHGLSNNQEITVKHLKQLFKGWSAYLSDCDCAIFEASYPSSVHVGFDMGAALNRGKPIVILYQEKRNPVFIPEFYSPKIIKCEYDQASLERTVDWALAEAEKLSNRRFTFFISPEIENYLNEIIKEQNVSRSEFIRHLIEEKMRQD